MHGDGTNFFFDKVVQNNLFGTNASLYYKNVTHVLKE